MKIFHDYSRRGERGLTLMLVMAFMAVSFLIISGVLYSTANSGRLGARHEQYYSAQEAATAAIEKVVAAMLRDLHTGGREAVWYNRESYKFQLPDASECPEWAEDYEFLPLQVDVVARDSYSELTWKYRGLAATNDVYRVQARVRTLKLDRPMTSVVEQEIQVAEIPVVAFQAYSENDLTFITPPGNNIRMNGRVHSNGKIYVYPSSDFVFGDHVTAAEEILHEQHPADPSGRSFGSITYEREADSQANTFRLESVVAPGGGGPVGGGPRGLLERLADLADYTVETSTNAIDVRDKFLEPILENVWTNFIRTNSQATNRFFEFEDRREVLRVHTTDVDVAGLVGQFDALGLPPGRARKIFLRDVSDHGPNTLSAFRLVNAGTLPASGLSIVTTNALYVQGDFNLNRAPVLLAGDAVTILSGAWDDSRSGGDPTERPAQDTTVNAAIVTGTVPGEFDGGIFNALRLLENWSGRTLVFNGSIATLYTNTFAVEPWRAGEPYFYAAPTTRVFNYDTSFTNRTSLPNGTPVLHTLIRGELVNLPPDAEF
jgi:hypothetical protein